MVTLKDLLIIVLIHFLTKCFLIKQKFLWLANINLPFVIFYRPTLLPKSHSAKMVPKLGLPPN